MQCNIKGSAIACESKAVARCPPDVHAPVHVSASMHIPPLPHPRGAQRMHRSITLQTQAMRRPRHHRCNPALFLAPGLSTRRAAHRYPTPASHSPR
eukprot:10000575-Alexandrium_andersonii.AAC.1